MGHNARALAEREFDRDRLAAAGARGARGGDALTELSYCVVNTNGRDHLLACLEAIDRTHPAAVEHEVLVLDNASGDGSADAVRERHPAARVIALDRRTGKAENDSLLLREARGRFCLLLNEDSELCPGAARALLDSLESDPSAAVAGAQLLTSDGQADGLRVAAAGRRLGARGRRLPRTIATPCRAAATRCARWAGCSRARCSFAARRPSRSAGSTRTSSSTPTRPTSASGCTMPAGGSCSFRRRAPSTTTSSRPTPPRCEGESSSSTAIATSTSSKHRMPVTRALWRLCWTWAYLVRAAAALVLPGHDPRRYLTHARQQLAPGRGEGIREAAEAYNRAHGV